jgi:hypothetical protein
VELSVQLRLICVLEITVAVSTEGAFGTAVRAEAVFELDELPALSVERTR